MNRRSLLKSIFLLPFTPTLFKHDINPCCQIPIQVRDVKTGFRYDDIYISPEALEYMRNWGVDQIDETTQKEIFLCPTLRKNHQMALRYSG